MSYKQLLSLRARPAIPLVMRTTHGIPSQARYDGFSFFFALLQSHLQIKLRKVGIA